MKFAPISAFNSHQFHGKCFLTIFREFFTFLFLVDFINELFGNASEKSLRYGQKFFMGKLKCVECKNRSILYDPL